MSLLFLVFFLFSGDCFKRATLTSCIIRISLITLYGIFLAFVCWFYRENYECTSVYIQFSRYCISPFQAGKLSHFRLQWKTSLILSQTAFLSTLYFVCYHNWPKTCANKKLSLHEISEWSNQNPQFQELFPFTSICKNVHPSWDDRLTSVLTKAIANSITFGAEQLSTEQCDNTEHRVYGTSNLDPCTTSKHRWQKAMEGNGGAETAVGIQKRRKGAMWLRPVLMGQRAWWWAIVCLFWVF